MALCTSTIPCLVDEAESHPYRWGGIGRRHLCQYELFHEGHHRCLQCSCEWTTDGAEIGALDEESED